VGWGGGIFLAGAPRLAPPPPPPPAAPAHARPTRPSETARTPPPRAPRQVDVLDYYDAYAYSAYAAHSLPAVLRARASVSLHDIVGRVALTRRNVLSRDRHTCQWVLGGRGGRGVCVKTRAPAAGRAPERRTQACAPLLWPSPPLSSTPSARRLSPGPPIPPPPQPKVLRQPLQPDAGPRAARQPGACFGGGWEAGGLWFGGDAGRLLVGPQSRPSDCALAVPRTPPLISIPRAAATRGTTS
jgi:hypothetical protein